jgi:hypothetical protein
MDYILEVHASANEELEQSFHWYEERGEGLGEKFLLQINDGLNRILRDPERYAVRKEGFRELGIKKFPFVIVYQILADEGVIFITDFFHTKRNPALKYQRRR